MGRRTLLVAIATAILAPACGSGVGDVTGVLESPLPTSRTTTPTPTPVPSPDPAGGAKPPIVVRAPLAGDEVLSPATIAGTANVFEATVSIRILDASGRELAATTTTATCGTGCRGRYSAEVFFFTQTRQDGTIEVFESSAQDGSRLNLVSVPVVLVPGV